MERTLVRFLHKWWPDSLSSCATYVLAEEDYLVPLPCSQQSNGGKIGDSFYRFRSAVRQRTKPNRYNLASVSFSPTLSRPNPTAAPWLASLSFSLYQQRRYEKWTGYLKCREIKTGFSQKRYIQTGSSVTLIGWKFGNTTYVICLSIGPNGGSVAMDSVVHRIVIFPPLLHWCSLWVRSFTSSESELPIFFSSTYNLQ
jgi:hypothetical protein